MSRMWLVRAGENAYLIDEFKERSAVAIGWAKLGNLKGKSTLAEIKTLLKENYPDYKDGKINITAGQILRFVQDFKHGDKVITYNPQERLYYIGKIISDYIYNPFYITDKPNIRNVIWEETVSRDCLSVSARNTLGSIMTIISISDDIQKEILEAAGTKTVDPSTGKEHKAVSDSSIVAEEQADDMEMIKEDMISKSMEFIKDRIASLDWEQMQEFVAGILRAMGYKTRISKKGPDRGRDILASPDGLGLESPRIIVEVKHRTGSMGAQEIRSFTGGLRQGDRGIYVSTGGFSKEAKYEADRSNHPLSLLDLNDMTELVMHYYDQFDSETRTLVPLKKMYWPV